MGAAGAKEALSVVPKSSPRSVFRYTVPAKCTDGVITSFGVTEVTLDEELAAGERRKIQTNDDARALENAKSCIVEINGKPVSLADGSVDIAIKQMTSKTRQLLVSAYVKHNMPSDAEAKDFFDSLKESVTQT